MAPNIRKIGFGGLSSAVEIEARPAASPMKIPADELVVQLYEELREAVCRYLAGMGVDRAAADELCQEAFLRLYVALRNRERIANPRGWVFTVAHNAGLNARARERRHEALDENAALPAAAGEDPETATIQGEKHARLHRLVEALPEQQRQCLNLRAEGFRYREIAGILGVSVSTVAGALRRTVLRIKESIDE